MVDCHPEETLSTEAEPRGECPHFLHSFNIMLSNVLSPGDIFIDAANRPPLVSQFEPYAHISHACDIFLNVTLPNIAHCNQSTESTAGRAYMQIYNGW